MFKNKASLKHAIKIIMVFAIFMISCLTLVDSATAVEIDSIQNTVSEKIDSVDEESVESVPTYFTFQNEVNDNKNEILKISILSNSNENSQNNDKTNEKESAENIETIPQYKNTKIISFTTAKAEENVDNASSNNENVVATISQNVNEPVVENYDIREYIGILVTALLFIASFSSFILYLKI
jgi:hypothetical protein